MSHNQDRFETFAKTYRASLLAAVEADAAKPLEDREYIYSPAGVDQVATRMLDAVASHPMGVNYDGGGFRRTCKALGIKHTRKAILAYLAGT